MDAQQLRCQLQGEIAARREHENQCAAKTRQLWQLREQHDQEIRRYQEQLSVVRASLLQHLAHKARLQVKCKHSTNVSPTEVKVISKIEADVPAADDGLPVAAGSPKRRKHVMDQISRAAPDSTATPPPATAATSDEGTNNVFSVAPTAAADDSSCPAENGLAQCAGDGKCTASMQHNDRVDVSSATSSAATVLLATAAKLQQLVGELTQREPAVAADLSILQWQVTAAYGSIMGTASRSTDTMLRQQDSSSADDDAAKAAAAASHEPTGAAGGAGSGSGRGGSSNPSAMPVTPNGSLKPQPVDVHPLEPEQSAATAAGAHPAQCEADIAAAARLFSGAASAVPSAHMDWYYLEGGSVRGPHDAAQMIRWLCSFYLEDQLLVAGVTQQMTKSSQPPPTAAFEPLRSLLEKVLQGGSYMPHGVTAAGRPSMSQMLVVIPASPPPRARRSQRQLPGLSPRSKPALTNLDQADMREAAAAEVATGHERALPVSTSCSEPAPTPTAAAVQQWDMSSSGGRISSMWGSGRRCSSSQMVSGQQQQLLLMDGTGVGIEQLGLKQIAAGLRDSARLDASPLTVASTAPVAKHRHNRGSQHLGSLIVAQSAQAGRLAGGAAGHVVVQQHAVSCSHGSTSSSGGGWGIQAALDTVGIFSAVEGIASQVAEQLDSLDTFAAGVAQGTPRDAHDTEAGGAGCSALDFVSDFPQLFPAAVMSDVMQRNSAAGATHQPRQAAVTPAVSRNHATNDSSSSGTGGDVGGVGSLFSLSSLPGVWRVESLHQLLRAMSPEPSPNVTSTAEP